MGFLKSLDHHTGLVNSMAATVHADLATALQHSQLSGQELRNAVLSCMGCEKTEACEGWLADHAAGADQTPAYCRNGALMARLQNA